MKSWTVVADRRVAKQLEKLPTRVVMILDRLRYDLEHEGPTPKGWITKHVRGRKGMYSIRLKREYRAFYEVTESEIILRSVTHRKNAY